MYTDNSLAYAIDEYPASTAFSAKSIIPGTVGVPYQMDTAVKFSAVDVEVPFIYDDRQVRTIKLDGGLEFKKAFKKGDDITSWFTNAPSGLKFSVYADTEQYDKSVSVYVSGTPEKMSTDSIFYRIPKDVLSFSGTVNKGTVAEKTYSHENFAPKDGVDVSVENRSNYSIYGLSVEKPETLYVRGPASSDIETVSATINLTDNLCFKVSRDAGFDISSWFKNVWASNPSGKSDQFTYTLATAVVNGSSTFKFNVSGLQGENGMGGAALFAIEIPSSFLQDTTGAELPSNYNYKVAVSTSYSDIAEEYARIYLATPQLRIISTDRDFYAVMGYQYNEFTVTYRLENGAFNKNEIDLNQVYYSWANESLIKTNTKPNYGYNSMWSLQGSVYHKEWAEKLIRETPTGTYDVDKALGLKVVDVTDDQITVKYYGIVLNDYFSTGINRTEEPLYLTIPGTYIIGSTSDGVTSLDPITIHYEEPVISFAPYGFYANDDIRRQEISELETKVKGEATPKSEYYDNEHMYARLSYDLSGVVGQDLSEYSYDINNNYEGNRRNHEYHYYAFAPLNFDIVKDSSLTPYEEGDDVTDLFFNKIGVSNDGSTKEHNIGITWKIVKKVKDSYGNLTLDKMNASLGGSKKLLSHDVKDRYIYIVAAKGIPNFYTEYTEDENENAKIEVTYSYADFYRYCRYEASKNYVERTQVDVSPSAIKSAIAPSYELTSDMTEYTNRITLSYPRYNFFSLYIPFRDWEYRVNSATYPYTVISGYMKDTPLEQYYDETKVLTTLGYPTINDQIPIYINGNIGLNKHFGELVNTNYFATRASDNSDYSDKNYRIYLGEIMGGYFYKKTMIYYFDPRVYSYSTGRQYTGVSLTFYDGYSTFNDQYKLILSGKLERGNLNSQLNAADTYALLSNGNFYFGNVNFAKNSDSAQGNTNENLVRETYRNNQTVYVGFRPSGTVYSGRKGSYAVKYVDLLNMYSSLSLWFNTNMFKTISPNKFGFTFTALDDKSQPFDFYQVDDYNYLSPKYDFSLPCWLKVTPFDPYYSTWDSGNETLQTIDDAHSSPGLITSGNIDFRAVVDVPVHISGISGISKTPVIMAIKLQNTTFNTDRLYSYQTVSDWFTPQLPEGLEADIFSYDSREISIRLSGTPSKNIDVEKTNFQITIPAYYNNLNEDLSVYTKESSYEFKAFTVSATGSIEGFVNKELKNSSFELKLSDSLRFMPSLYGQDLTSWFDPISGVTFKGGSVTSSGFTIIASGKPKNATAINNLTVRIPFSAIYNSNFSSDTAYTISDLKCTVYDNAKASLLEKVDVYHLGGVGLDSANAYIFTVNLTNAVFDLLSVGTDVSSWFGSSAKPGFKYVLQKYVHQGDKTAYIAVYGTPDKLYADASINIVIPSSALYNYSDSLTVDTKGSLYKEINQQASIVGDGVTIHKYRNNNFYQDFTIELTGGPGFIAISKGYNVSSWFDTILRGDVTYKVLNAVNNTDKRITIRMTTTQATATSYDSAKPYTITIPSVALIYESDPISVDVKGGTMRFDNYAQPSLKSSFYVIEGKYPESGLGLVHDPDDFDEYIFWWYTAVTNTNRSKHRSWIYPKDIDDMKKPYSFLFTFDNIKYVGHTDNRKYGYAARYQSYGYLTNDSNAKDEGQYRWARPWTMTYISNGPDGAGNYAGTFPRFGEENYAYWNDLPEVFIKPRSLWQSIMSTDTGMHIPSMIELWVHTFGTAARYIYNCSDRTQVSNKTGLDNLFQVELAEKSFQVVIFKKNKCQYKSCNLFKDRHGTKSGYVDVDFRVPVTDLGGNKVWVWARYGNVSHIRLGHNMY